MPKQKRVVIVGFGSGGFAAAIELRKSQKPFDVVIVDTKEYDLLHNCGLPYVINHEIQSSKDLTHNIDDMGFTRYHHHRAEALNAKTKRITISHVRTGKKKVLNYDYCILATGSRPFIPPIEGIAGVFNKTAFSVHTEKDIDAIIAHKGKKAVIIGAGAIGLETAACLKSVGYKVTVLEPGAHILRSAIDADQAILVEHYLRHVGIRVLTHHRANRIISKNGKTQFVEAQATTIPADLVVLATGIRPNTDFLEKSSVKTNKGSIPVNHHLQTSSKSVYAIGDIVLVKSVLSGKLTHSGLATLAYLQGQAAARHIMKKPHSTYPGVYNTFVTKIGKLEIASTGFNSQQATAEHYDIINTTINKSTNPDWFPGGHDLSLQLVVDLQTKKILGAQAVGKEGAAARINVISAALKGELDVYQLRELELAYCPPVSDVADVLTVAADTICRRLSRIKNPNTYKQHKRD